MHWQTCASVEDKANNAIVTKIEAVLSMIVEDNRWWALPFKVIQIGLVEFLLLFTPCCWYIYMRSAPMAAGLHGGAKDNLGERILQAVVLACLN